MRIYLYLLYLLYILIDVEGDELHRRYAQYVSESNRGAGTLCSIRVPQARVRSRDDAELSYTEFTLSLQRDEMAIVHVGPPTVEPVCESARQQLRANAAAVVDVIEWANSERLHVIHVISSSSEHRWSNASQSWRAFAHTAAVLPHANLAVPLPGGTVNVERDRFRSYPVPPMPLQYVHSRVRRCEQCPSSCGNASRTVDYEHADLQRSLRSWHAIVDSSDALVSYVQRRGVRFLIYVGAFSNDELLFSSGGGILHALGAGLHVFIVRDAVATANVPTYAPYLLSSELHDRTVAWYERYVCPSLSATALRSQTFDKPVPSCAREHTSSFDRLVWLSSDAQLDYVWRELAVEERVDAIKAPLVAVVYFDDAIDENWSGSTLHVDEVSINRPNSIVLFNASSVVCVGHGTRNDGGGNECSVVNGELHVVRVDGDSLNGLNGSSHLHRLNERLVYHHNAHHRVLLIGSCALVGMGDAGAQKRDNVSDDNSRLLGTILDTHHSIIVAVLLSSTSDGDRWHVSPHGVVVAQCVPTRRGVARVYELALNSEESSSLGSFVQFDSSLFADVKRRLRPRLQYSSRLLPSTSMRADSVAAFARALTHDAHLGEQWAHINPDADCSRQCMRSGALQTLSLRCERVCRARLSCSLLRWGAADTSACVRAHTDKARERVSAQSTIRIGVLIAADLNRGALEWPAATNNSRIELALPLFVSSMPSLVEVARTLAHANANSSGLESIELRVLFAFSKDFSVYSTAIGRERLQLLKARISSLNLPLTFEFFGIDVRNVHNNALGGDVDDEYYVELWNRMGVALTSLSMRANDSVCDYFVLLRENSVLLGDRWPFTLVDELLSQSFLANFGVVLPTVVKSTPTSADAPCDGLFVSSTHLDIFDTFYASFSVNSLGSLQYSICEYNQLIYGRVATRRSAGVFLRRLMSVADMEREEETPKLRMEPKSVWAPERSGYFDTDDAHDTDTFAWLQLARERIRKWLQGKSPKLLNEL